MRNFLTVFLAVMTSVALSLGGAYLLGAFDKDSVQATKTVSVQPANPAKKPSEYKTPSEIYKDNQSGVLFISTKGTKNSASLFGPTTEQTAGQGSGFLIDHQGYVLTNAHVVADSSEVSVVYKNKSVKAEIIGTDTSTDLSLLKIDPKAFDLKPLKLGESKSLQVGDAVLAIGNPLGYDHTLTTGVVSALGRTIPSPNGFQIPDAIQTDASINPGNSGGPLFNDLGEVVGITSQIATDGESSSSIGIGFAIPIDIAKKLVPQLKQGNIKRAYIGIQGASVKDLKTTNKQLPKQGVVVISTTPGGPADQAGIKAAQQDGTIGDIITHYNQQKITSMQQLVSLVEKSQINKKYQLTVMRNGEQKQISVLLKQRPDKDSSQTNTQP